MRKLTDRNQAEPNKGTRLTTVKETFKISLCKQLDNGFDFKTLKNGAIKSFHTFLDRTVDKNLTISEVDSLYLRTRGNIKQNINGIDVIHYGIDNTAFRIFGYYNQDGYFNITRIDPNHRTNK